MQKLILVFQTGAEMFRLFFLSRSSPSLDYYLSSSSSSIIVSSSLQSPQALRKFLALLFSICLRLALRNHISRHMRHENTGHVGFIDLLCADCSPAKLAQIFLAASEQVSSNFLRRFTYLYFCEMVP